jgi:hypothetical protein
MNAVVSEMHSTTCSTVVSPFHHHTRRSKIRNHTQFRIKSSILIPKQDTKLKEPISDSITRRLILLRHAESSWEPSIRGKRKTPSFLGIKVSNFIKLGMFPFKEL